MTRVLLSDLFSTLVPGGDAERTNSQGRIAAALGVREDDLRREFDASAMERYTGVFPDLTVMLRTLAERCGGAPGNDQLADAVRLRQELSARLLASPPAGTLTALDTLTAAGWRLGLVSNISPDTQRRWPAGPLAPYFTTTAFSAELGLAKPDPAIYLTACRALGADPADCVFVGDGNDSELAGAAALGMLTIRTTEHSDSDPAWTGPSIAAFADLPAFLGVPEPGPR